MYREAILSLSLIQSRFLNVDQVRILYISPGNQHRVILPSSIPRRPTKKGSQRTQSINQPTESPPTFLPPSVTKLNHHYVPVIIRKWLNLHPPPKSRIALETWFSGRYHV